MNTKVKGSPVGNEVIEMLVGDFISIPDNPRQRDTERHLMRSAHLRTPSPTHRHVAIAVTKSGLKWKLDGHTRALGWDRRILPIPKTVIVSIFPVDNDEEAATLYTHFDAAESVETAADKVFGAYREVDYTPRSTMLRKGSITSAVRLAEGCSHGARFASKAPVYGLIELWLPEIKLFDDINPVQSRFTAGLMAAVLMTFRRDKKKATDFWSKYNDDAGEKVEGAMDPVEALSRFMMETRKTKGDHGGGSTMDQIGKGLAAYEAHQDHKTYTRNLNGIEPSRFLLSK